MKCSENSTVHLNLQHSPSIPEIQGPPSIPDIQGPPSISDIQGPPSIPDIQGPPSIPDTHGPPSISDIQGPPSIPKIQGLPSIPDIQGPPSISDTHGPPSIPKIQGPPSIPDIQGPCSVKFSQSRRGLTVKFCESDCEADQTVCMRPVSNRSSELDCFSWKKLAGKELPHILSIEPIANSSFWTVTESDSSIESREPTLSKVNRHTVPVLTCPRNALLRGCSVRCALEAENILLTLSENFESPEIEPQHVGALYAVSCDRAHGGCRP
ncbi:hypothetical protein BV898_20114 [Hypsibius exemplaris]|uniref:Uncharacterized protein n=1 Tax=Hypsibius exemplaris TaxID=2072580 RepID=A0A9X6NMR0_HYPEX|nr:hypothetical protein BV898_20114 [Hypsibius exemplaris]